MFDKNANLCSIFLAFLLTNIRSDDIIDSEQMFVNIYSYKGGRYENLFRK